MKLVRLCPICGGEAFTDSVICPDCASELDEECFDSFMHRCPVCFYPRISDLYFCQRCAHAKENNRKVHRIYSVARYDGKLSFSIVDSFKFHNHRKLAPVVALYLKRGLNVLDPSGESVIVPVPCSRGRLLKFGWDQMLEVCKALKRPYVRLLERNEGTQGPQKYLDRSQREQASEGKFCMNSRIKDLQLYRNRKIIIIDDILTTGSTMEAAMSLLEGNGFSDVCGATWLAEL